MVGGFFFGLLIICPTRFGLQQIRKEVMTCEYYFKNRVCATQIGPELQIVPLGQLHIKNVLNMPFHCLFIFNPC